MRRITKDESFEVLLIAYVDSVPYEEALSTVFHRKPSEEEIAYFYELCLAMRKGWVRMNQNIRNL